MSRISPGLWLAEWSLEIPLSIQGVTGGYCVMTVELFIDEDGDLHKLAIRPYDETDNRRAFLFGKSTDPLTSMVWNCAQQAMDESGERIKELAGWEDGYAEEPAWTGPEYRRAGVMI